MKDVRATSDFLLESQFASLFRLVCSYTKDWIFPPCELWLLVLCSKRMKLACFLFYFSYNFAAQIILMWISSHAVIVVTVSFFPQNVSHNLPLTTTCDVYFLTFCWLRHKMITRISLACLMYRKSSKLNPMASYIFWFWSSASLSDILINWSDNLLSTTF